MKNYLKISIVCLSFLIILAVVHKIGKPRSPRIGVSTPAIKSPTIKATAKVLTPSQEGLIQGGLLYPRAKVCQSTIHPLLTALAHEHAVEMCRLGLGHQNFNQRANTAMQLGGDAHEICAMITTSSTNLSQIGLEMFACWKTSPKHWSVACQPHRLMGGDMVQASDGRWYACILTID
jgi:hypothetical protein